MPVIVIEAVPETVPDGYEEPDPFILILLYNVGLFIALLFINAIPF